MTLQGKRALVTGAGGFIASHLAESLVRAGVRTRGLVHYNSRGDEGQLAWLDPEIRRQLEVLPGDVRDRWLRPPGGRGLQTWSFTWPR